MIAEFLDNEKLGFVKNLPGDAATAAHCYVVDDAQADRLLAVLNTAEISASKGYQDERLLVEVPKAGMERLGWNVEIKEPKAKKYEASASVSSGANSYIINTKAGTGRCD